MLTNLPDKPFQMVGVAGSGQSAVIGNTFLAPLSGTVEDQFNNPVLAGINVTLTAPGAGASGTLAGANPVPTNSSGVFTSGLFTANSTFGAYNVVATSTTGSATTNYALVNTDFALALSAPSTVYIQGTSTPLGPNTAPMLTVTPLPAPPATSYSGTVTPVCVLASLPAGVTCASFTPPTAAFANGSPASVLSAATLNIAATAPVGLYPAVVIMGADTSPVPDTHTTSFALAIQCTYSLGNTTATGTVPAYDPLTPSTPYTFFVTESAGGSACPYSLSPGAGITIAGQATGTITAPGTGSAVAFGVSPTGNFPQNDQISVSYPEFDKGATTGTSTLTVTQEAPVSLTAGVGTFSVSLTAGNQGTLNIPNVSWGTGVNGVTTACAVANNAGIFDATGNNYGINCTAKVTNNTALLSVVVGPIPAAAARKRKQLALFYAGGLGFPAIVFVGLGASVFGPKRKRLFLRRITSMLGVLMLLSLLVLLPSCGGGFSAKFITQQAASYNLTVMGYVNDPTTNNVTAVEIFAVPTSVVQ
jgi:hypothetical protein